jgi:hypothetical protein
VELPLKTVLPPLTNHHPPPSGALSDHARELYTRLREAVVVPYVDVGDSAWRPAVQDCHGNCEAWCAQHPEYQLVRGWICVPMTGLAYCRFLAHSVVRQPDGTLIDITPRGPLREAEPYRFLPTFVSNDEYETLVVDLYGVYETGYLDWQHTAT